MAIAFVGTVFAFSSALCTAIAAPHVAGELEPGINVMAFFVKSKSNMGVGLMAYENGQPVHQLSQTVAGSSVYSVKWSPDVFEKHEVVGDYIYLREDVTGSSSGSYSFSKGLWLKKIMKTGESLTTRRNMISWYDANCRVTKQGFFDYTTKLEAYIPKFELGGDLGSQDVILVSYNWGAGLEHFYYARNWGWVRWDFWHEGQFIRSLVFNRKTTSPIPPNTGKVCSGQIGTRIPLPVHSVDW